MKDIVRYIQSINEAPEAKCKKALNLLDKVSLHNEIVFTLRVFLLSKNKYDSGRQTEFLEDVHKRVSLQIPSNCRIEFIITSFV